MVVACGALLVAGCGVTRGTSDGSATSAPIESQVPTSAEPADPDAPTTGQSTEDEVQPDDIVLAVDDLPTGWSERQLSATDTPIECLAAMNEVGGDEKVRAAFLAPDGESELSQAVIPGDEAFDTFVQQFDSCGEFSFDVDGVTLRGSIGPLSMDPIEGVARTATYRLSASTGLQDVEGVYVIMAGGGFTMGLSLVAEPRVDLEQAAEVAQIAASKLPS